jgi:cytidylate kinase
MIIAIDGPAASGKGTLARRLAGHYGLAYLDTGSLYRAVAHGVLAVGGDPADEDDAVAAARRLGEADIPEDALRTPAVSQAASVVAAIPAVRKAILAFQREFAARPPGAVLDGRDIGTIVCPDADVKLFVTASAETRARRRYLELAASGGGVDEAHVLADLMERDRRDRERDVAPLVQAADAHLLDTTDLGIEAAFKAAVELIDAATGQAGCAR